jgi:hypothetical protein
MIDPEKVYHIFPLDDLDKHIFQCEYPVYGTPFCPCKCNPEWKEEDDALLIVHNSFDGREGVEWANEILNSTDPFS